MVLNKYKWWLISGLILIIILAAAGVGYFWLKPSKTASDVVATVGNEKIMKADLEKAIKGLSLGRVEDASLAPVSDEMRTQLIDKLIENKIIENKSKTLGISVSSADVIKKSKELNGSYETLSVEEKQYIDSNSRLLLLKDRVSDKIVSWSSGKFILARFDMHFSQEPSNKDQATRRLLAGENKSYAEKLINSLYADIRSGKITFEEGMVTVLKDATIGESSWYDWTVTQSRDYTKEDSVTKPYPASSPDFWEKVSAVKVGEMSAPMLIKTTLEMGSVLGDSGSTADGMYLVVRKDNGNTGEAADYETWLVNEKNRLDVKIINTYSEDK